MNLFSLRSTEIGLGASGKKSVKRLSKRKVSQPVTVAEQPTGL